MTASRYLFLFLCAALLSACGGGKEGEVRQWMVTERNRTQPTVAPLPAPKVFAPEQYQGDSSVEPFSNLKLAQALKRDASQSSTSGALVAPELKRRKEPLEAFPLDAMKLVGSIVRDGQPVALVKVDNLLYQVKLGNYLGLDYGRVTKITATELSVREIVQDAVGEWIERAATLQLQEKAK